MVETLLKVAKISFAISSKIGVSHSNDVQTATVCQVVDGAVRTSISYPTVTDHEDSDKYELEIQPNFKILDG